MDIDRILSDLRDPDMDVKCRAAANLLEIGDQQVIEPLVLALSDENVWARQWVTVALGQISDERIVAPLIAALKDQNAYVREAAVEALGRIGDTRAIGPLIAVLCASNSHTDLVIDAADALAKIGSAATGLLIAIASDPAKPIDSRERATFALGRLGDAEAADSLMDVLREEAGLRGTAAAALGTVGHKPAAKLLMGILHDPDWTVRSRAVSALGMVGELAALPDLERLALEEKDKRVVKVIQETIEKLRRQKPG